VAASFTSLYEIFCAVNAVRKFSRQLRCDRVTIINKFKLLRIMAYVHYIVILL